MALKQNKNRENAKIKPILHLWHVNLLGIIRLQCFEIQNNLINTLISIRDPKNLMGYFQKLNLCSLEDDKLFKES